MGYVLDKVTGFFFISLFYYKNVLIYSKVGGCFTKFRFFVSIGCFFKYGFFRLVEVWRILKGIVVIDILWNRFR